MKPKPFTSPIIQRKLNEVRELGIWDREQEWMIGTLQKIIDPTDREMKLLFKWRKNNQATYHDKHEITLETTKDWWRNYMLGSRERILFWVDDNDGTHIGHIGLANFTNRNTCELDNVIRGRNKSDGIMYFAAETLIHWAFGKLKVKGMSLRTRFDNLHAKRFYEFLNFKEDVLKYESEVISPLITMKYKGLWTKLK
jgi:RimJ/RimL family protein N-acetyltransferase